MQLLTGVVRDSGTFCPLCATFLSILSSSSCFSTSWSQDGSWTSRYHAHGLGRNKKNDEGGRGLSAESDPFEREGRKLSQKPQPAAWLLLTFHWPELDHRATSSWKVARKMRAERVNHPSDSTTRLWCSHSTNLSGPYEGLWVTQEPAGKLVCQHCSFLSIDTGSGQPVVHAVCPCRFLAEMGFLPMPLSAGQTLTQILTGRFEQCDKTWLAVLGLLSTQK